MKLVPYQPGLRKEWDDFIGLSRNATFLLNRGFMDYHSDRFTDASLLLYKGKKVLAAFPASCHTDCAISHGGLTYGGFIVGNDTHACDVGVFLQLAKEHYKSLGITKIIIKPIPYIYQRYPSDDQLYWLYRQGAQRTSCSLSTAIDLSSPLPFSTLRRRKVKNAIKSSLQACCTHETSDYETYWDVLSSVLMQQHGKKPVHTLDEILRLQDLFPNNIILYVVKHPQDGRIIAGTLIFVTPQVIHAQYIASSDEGKELGALDFLFDYLIRHYARSSHRYFDFGISTEAEGQYLNEGLNFQKEGFGGRSVIYDTYTLDL